MSHTIGLVLKPGVPEAIEGVRTICALAPNSTLLIEESGYHAVDSLPMVERVTAAEMEARSDLLVVFGGDGTLIHAAGLLPNRVVPILGVNLGLIGFLTEVNFEEFPKALELALAGELPHSDRMRLDVEICREGEVVFTQRILNDAVLARQALSRITTFRLELGPRLITQLRGDGVIVSTPTGSTAYGMAAGGSILTPNLEAVGIAPICPYQLSQRPLVLKPVEPLRLTLDGDGPVYATCDGQSGIEFETRDEMIIRRAPVDTRILTVPWRDYFEMLRVKLRWGGGR